MRKKILIIAILASLALLIFLIIISFFISTGGQKKGPLPSITPVPTDFSKDYSSFYKIVPGKNTLEDVEKINGLPSSISSAKNGVYMHYKTPSQDYENTVFLQNNIVVYALENVFSKYRGFYSDYVKTYSSPNLHLYNSDGNPFDWFVFLNRGIAIETSNNEITAMLYFAPQSKESFMARIAKDLMLVETSPSTQGEQLIP